MKKGRKMSIIHPFIFAIRLKSYLSDWLLSYQPGLAANRAEITAGKSTVKYFVIKSQTNNKTRNKIVILSQKCRFAA
jgi:hypothetical protein